MRDLAALLCAFVLFTGSYAWGQAPGSASGASLPPGDFTVAFVLAQWFRTCAKSGGKFDDSRAIGYHQSFRIIPERAVFGHDWHIRSRTQRPKYNRQI